MSPAGCEAVFYALTENYQQATQGPYIEVRHLIHV